MRNKTSQIRFIAGPNNVPVPAGYIIVLEDTVLTVADEIAHEKELETKAANATTIRECIKHFDDIGGDAYDVVFEYFFERNGTDDEPNLDQPVPSELYDRLWEKAHLDPISGTEAMARSYGSDDCYQDLKYVPCVHPFWTVSTYDPSAGFKTEEDLEKAMDALRAEGHHVERDDARLSKAYSDD